MCPVTGGLALAGGLLGTGFTAAAGTAAIAASTTMMASAIAIGGAAAIGAGIGVVANGAVNSFTGRGFFEGAGRSALIGGFSAGLGAYASGTEAFQSFSNLGPMGSPDIYQQAASYAVQGASATAIAGTTAVGSLGAAMQPQAYDASLFAHSPTLYNSLHNKVTGSGGHQAAASLNDAIRKVKSKRGTTAKSTPRPTDVSPVNTSNFSDIGLQIA